MLTPPSLSSSLPLSLPPSPPPSLQPATSGYDFELKNADARRSALSLPPSLLPSLPPSLPPSFPPSLPPFPVLALTLSPKGSDDDDDDDDEEEEGSESFEACVRMRLRAVCDARTLHAPCAERLVCDEICVMRVCVRARAHVHGFEFVPELLDRYVADKLPKP
eukprot:3639935-Rhodomonas_salina.1